MRDYPDMAKWFAPRWIAQRRPERLGFGVLLFCLGLSLSVRAGAAPTGDGQADTAHVKPAQMFSNGQAARRLGMDKAVALALSTHPSMQAALAAVRSAVTRRKAVSATWHPRVNLQVGYMFRGPLQKLEISQQMDTPVGPMDVNFRQNLGSYNNFNATLQAGWRAWDWGVRVLAAKAADKGVAAARQGRKQARASLAYAVRQTYLALLLSRRLEEVARFGVRLANKRLEEQRVKAKAGIVKELDLVRARSTLAERKAGLESATQQVRKLARVLALLCGLPGRVDASDDLDRLAARAMPRVRRLDLVPSVRAMRLAADATRLSARMELRQRWPTVDLTAGASLLYPKNFFEKKWGPAYWAGVVLTWTLWDGLSHNRAAERARAEARKVRRQAAAETRKIRQELVADKADWRAAAANLVAAEQRLVAARAYLKAARAALTAGTARPLDLLAAEQALLGSQASLAKARFERAMARAKLLFHLGIAEDPAGHAGAPGRRSRRIDQ